MTIEHDPRGAQWEAVYRTVARRGDVGATARLVAAMLEDPQHPRVPEILGAGRSALANTPLWSLAIGAPELVPIDVVRVLARDANPGVRDAAVQILGILHHPDDAELVLAHHVARGETLTFQKTHDVAWLAGLPGSERLVPLLEPKSLFELARRRRCANLPTVARAQARALLAMERAEEWVARIAFELDDRALAAELATKRPSKMIEEWTPPPMTRTTGDLRFADNRLDDTMLVDSSAYAAYAYALRVNPGDAHAALQLAWIDRAYGTPITDERIAWLRALGVTDDELLEELAVPAAPIAGIRAPRREAEPQRAAHLERVRRATGTAAGPPGSRS